ncbi:EAL domain-containing protein [Deefgea sp. CFH1-16]|uniref:EAL domain-containing protein n=1 Tax=Deefgea sp. CFH1-16 TaxID=2675457 RepID=UPI0015F743A5|nr:EAL domain-containing protein [Deefgea sp. CFH1-16]MBM5574495.1 EAL domain-containing protein [Deefgea sp. CFH1-16]
MAYLKIDGSYILDIDQHTGNQRLLKEVVRMADSLGILTIAEQVRTEAEWLKLQELGLGGVTGLITKDKISKI